MFSRAFLFLEILPRKIFKGLYATKNGISGNQYCGHVCVIVYAEKYGER